jgi:hypothetical protein
MLLKDGKKAERTRETRETRETRRRICIKDFVYVMV